MWLISRIGMFSIVAKPWDEHRGTLTVRSRVQGDLDALRAQYLPQLTPTKYDRYADYAYRAQAPRDAVMSALSSIVGDLDYPDFKQEVERVQGTERAVVYSAVWSALRRLQKPLPPSADIPTIYAGIGNRPDVLDNDELGEEPDRR